jgi:hypothetical protein
MILLHSNSIVLTHSSGGKVSFLLIIRCTFFPEHHFHLQVHWELSLDELTDLITVLTMAVCHYKKTCALAFSEG